MTTQPKSCTLQAGPSLLPAITGNTPYTVRYEASGSGEATLATLSYRDGDGQQHTIDGPTLPWSMTLTMPAGTQAGLSGTGTVTDGQLTLRLEADNGAGSTVDADDRCEQSVD